MIQATRATLFSLCLVGLFFGDMSQSQAQLFRRFGCAPRLGMFRRGCCQSNFRDEWVHDTCINQNQCGCCVIWKPVDCGSCALIYDELLQKYVWSKYCEDEASCMCSISIPLTRFQEIKKKLTGNCTEVNSTGVDETMLYLKLSNSSPRHLMFYVDGSSDEEIIDTDILIPYNGSSLTKWVIKRIHYRSSGHAKMQYEGVPRDQYVSIENKDGITFDWVTPTTGNWVMWPVQFSDSNNSIEFVANRFKIQIERVFDND